MGAEVGGKMRDDGDRTRGPNRKGVRGGGGGGGGTRQREATGAAESGRSQVTGPLPSDLPLPCRTRRKGSTHLPGPVGQHLQHPEAHAVSSALEPPLQVRYRRHPALVVLHQLGVHVGERREGDPPPVPPAAQGTVEDGGDGRRRGGAAHGGDLVLSGEGEGTAALSAAKVGSIDPSGFLGIRRPVRDGTADAVEVGVRNVECGTTE